MATKCITLLSNESATSAGKPWSGGRGSLVIAGTLATTTKLQIMGPDGSTWLDVETVTAAGITNHDLPAGSYRISLAGGSPAGIYAKLISVPYV